LDVSVELVQQDVPSMVNQLQNNGEYPASVDFSSTGGPPFCTPAIPFLYVDVISLEFKRARAQRIARKHKGRNALASCCKPV
jgi:hypothetical protein